MAIYLWPVKRALPCVMQHFLLTPRTRGGRCSVNVWKEHWQRGEAPRMPSAEPVRQAWAAGGSFLCCPAPGSQTVVTSRKRSRTTHQGRAWLGSDKALCTEWLGRPTAPGPGVASRGHLWDRTQVTTQASACQEVAPGSGLWVQATGLTILQDARPQFSFP